MATKTITVTSASVVTGDTLASYNAYTDKPSAKTLIGTMTPAEALAGKSFTLADGLNHNVTVYPVGTTTGEFNQPSNIVVVDLSGYIPSDQPNIKLALLSNSPLPIDVSKAEDGTGGNPIVTAAGQTDPTNLNGLNTFDGVDSGGDTTTLTSILTIAFTNTDFTEIFEVAFDSLTTVSTSYVKVGNANTSAFSLRSDNKLSISAGEQSDNTLLASTYFSVGVKRLVTIIFSSGALSVQFDNDAVIPLTIGTPTTIQSIRDFGGNTTLAGRELACKIGRYIAFDAALTGTALTDAKQWVSDGTP